MREGTLPVLLPRYIFSAHPTAFYMTGSRYMGSKGALSLQGWVGAKQVNDYSMLCRCALDFLGKRHTQIVGGLLPECKSVCEICCFLLAMALL